MIDKRSNIGTNNNDRYAVQLSERNMNMTLKNEQLISIVKALGEEKVRELLSAKLKHDAQQKSYHKQYNAKRNATFKNMREIAAEQGLTVEQLVARINAKANA